MLMVFIVAGCAMEQPQPQEEPEQPVEPDIPMDPTGGGELTSVVPDDLPQIVATVNGDQITRDEVETLEQQNQQMQGVTATLDELVEQLISSRVLLSILEDQGYQITKDDVENYYVEMGIQPEQLKTEVENMNMDYDDFLEQSKDELAFSQYLSEIQEDLEVTQEEVEVFYEEQRMVLDQEGLTYEDVEEDLYNYILEEKSHEVLISDIEQEMHQADIEIYY